MDSSKNFILTVPVGSTIIGSDGSQTKLIGVPANALSLWENGTRTLCLKKEGVEILNDHSTEQIQKLIEVRTKVGYKAEIELLKSVLKSAKKPAAEEKPVQTK